MTDDQAAELTGGPERFDCKTEKGRKREREREREEETKSLMLEKLRLSIQHHHSKLRCQEVSVASFIRQADRCCAAHCMLPKP